VNVPKRYLLLVGAVVVLVGLAWVWSLVQRQATPQPPQPQTERYLVGAHYSLDYPSAFQAGYLRAQLDPPQQPLLGAYDSLDISVLERHVQWASQFGLDFLVLEYRTDIHQHAQLFTSCRNLDDIRFCMSYSLKPLLKPNEQGRSRLDPSTIERLTTDVQKMATFFEHPRYFRFDDKPMLLLRDSFELHPSDCERLVTIVKELGFSLYVVGDEVHSSNNSSPQFAQRVRLFDAVTAVGFYRGEDDERTGYGFRSSYLSDLKETTRTISEKLNGKTPVLPCIIPGYNQRGRDPDTGVIPRVWEPNGELGSFMQELLEEYALAELEQGAPILFLDSFNRWEDDTAVEPLRPAPSTVRDQSGGQLLTDGYPYRGFGQQNLKILRDQLIAVTGTVQGKAGNRLPGVQVSAWQAGEVVANDVTDSEGRFHLSRKTVGEGTYLVGVTRLESVRVKIELLAPPEAVELDLVTLEPGTYPDHPVDLKPKFPEHRPDPDTILADASTDGYSVIERGDIRFYVHQDPDPVEKTITEDRDWESEVERVLKKNLSEGDTVVEVGAGLGVHSLMMASEVGESGRVYAIEPELERYRQLVANQKLNSFDQLLPIWYEVGRRPAAPVSPEVSEQRTLDTFHFDPVKLLKIDLEGREEEVIDGARSLLAQSRPVLVFKIHGSASDESERMKRRVAGTRGLLSSLGYQIEQLSESDTWVGHPFDLEANGKTQVVLDFGSPWVRENLIRGFSKDEGAWPDTWVWNEEVETESWLFLEEVEAGDYVLGFRGEAFSEIAPVEVLAFFNGAELGTFSLESGWTGVELTVPEGLLEKGRNRLTLRFSKSGTPYQLLPGSLDKRWLSARFDCLWLVPKP
jgi:glycoprotein endo-alpha-1,2-mannosidase